MVHHTRKSTITSRNQWLVRLILPALLLIFIASAHIMEDFDYDIPARFNLDTAPAVLLVGLAFTLQVTLLISASHNRPWGLLGTGFFGLLWALAALFDHIQEILFHSPYREGAISKILEIALIMVGFIVAAVGVLAWRETRKRPQ